MIKSASFPTTRWTRIVYARDAGNPRTRTAIEELFRLYWYPIYSFLRRSRFSHADAEDLTQGFFLFVCEKETFAKADPARGRFRTFILACLKNFLSTDYRGRMAAKRGGGRVIELDGVNAEARYALEPVDDLSPDKVFEREFAKEILASAMSELESEATHEGKGAVFSALRGHLNDEGTEGYGAISVSLNMPLGTVKSHAKRFRDRLRELILERVDHVVANHNEIHAEMQILGEAL